MRAELGPLVHELYSANADQILANLVGTRRLGPKNLSLLSLFWWLTRSHNNNTMPHQLEGFKLADRAGMIGLGARHAAPLLILMILMWLSSLLGLFFGAWAQLNAYYKLGEQKQLVSESFIRLQGWLHHLGPPTYISLVFTGLGFGFTLFLMLMHQRFLWWPWHPLGYAITQGDWAIKYLWFSLFLSWLVKGIILKYGGIRRYRHTAPLFLGFILGDFIIGGFWSLIGLSFNLPVYAFKNW